ncbi:MAG: LPS export ABC transporter periplasmic protein LptC [Geminicoccaceae bacterium]
MTIQATVGKRGSKYLPHLGGRHSRRVDRLRFLLPAIALSLLAVVVAWPWLVGGYHGLIVPVFKSIGSYQHDVMRMANPRYVGRTEASEPYEVTASSAFLDPTDPDRIHLDRLLATLERSDATMVHLRADEGLYLRERDALELDGDLELTFDPGYRFTTDSAHIDLGRGLVSGAEPVEGEGPIGTLAADAFDIEDGGKLLRFKGHVQMTVWPKGAAE